MATNKNALIRYRTIDKCLQNRSRKWTLDNLIEYCSDALYEFEGKNTNVSKRTIQLDIQLMRSNKLGYNAPIISYDKKYYTYEDETYSITDIPITTVDMSIIKESIDMLKQFKNFSLFSELNGVMQKLEDKVYRESTNESAIIHMDKNDRLHGIEHLDTLYQAILKKIVLRLTYRSFTARADSDFLFHGYILKEYNNRWFIIGQRNSEKKVLTLALDRIVNIDLSLNTEYLHRVFDADDYYKNTYGVTVLNDANLKTIVLKIERSNAPYVITKPFHQSQKLLTQHKDGSIEISIDVHHNYEIERLILGFGSSIEVISPMRLRRRIKSSLHKALRKYQPTENIES